MRILSFIHGMGLGHVYRNIPYLREMKKRGHEIFVGSYGKSLDILRREEFDEVIEIPKIGEIIHNKGEINIKESIIDNLKKIHPLALNKINKIIENHKPNVIINDGYSLPLILPKIRNIKTITIANCTNIGYVFPKLPLLSQGADIISKTFIELSDIIVVPDLPPPFTIAQKNIFTYGYNDKFRYVGTLTEGSRSNKKDYVYITMGGTKIKTDISRYKIDNFNVEISNGDIPYQENLKKISHAKAIITHGGHSTIMTAIKSNTPILAITKKEYLERYYNSIGVKDNGIGTCIDEKELTMEGIELGIEYITSKVIKNKMEVYSKMVNSIDSIYKMREIIEAEK